MHTHTYAHEHTCACMTPSTRWSTDTTYANTQARLERRRGSKCARSWYRCKEPCTSLSFDAIKPHLAPPMLGLHCTHFRRHQYPSTPHPLFPTYPRTVRGVKAAVQQRLSRWARRSSSLSPRMTKVIVHGETKGQWGTTKPHNSPSRNHDSAAPRQHPLICTGTEPIHQFMARPICELTSRCSEIGFTLSSFPRRFHVCLIVLGVSFPTTRFRNKFPVLDCYHSSLCVLIKQEYMLICVYTCVYYT